MPHATSHTTHPTTEAEPKPHLSRAWVVRLLVLAVGLLIAMAELDRLVSQILAPNGQAFSLTDVVGVGAFGAVSAWAGWAHATISVAPLVIAHVLLDLAFIASYFLLLRQLSAGRRWTVVLWVLLGADLLEDLFLLVQSALVTQREWSAIVAGLGAGASLAKWLAVLVLLVLAVRDHGPTLWQTARSLPKTLAIHRVGLSVVAILAAVSLIPQSGVLEQLPDIQRAWIFWRAGPEHGPIGPVIDGAAVAVSVVLAVVVWAVLFLIGRLRSRLAYASPRTRPFPDLALHIYAFIPAIVGLAIFSGLGIYGMVAFDDTYKLIDPVVFAIFLTLAILVPGASLIINAAKNRLGRTLEKPADRGSLRATGGGVRAVGDGIALASITIAGLGVVRSFAALALLGLPGFDNSTDGGELAALYSTVLVAGGLAAAVFAPEISRALFGFVRFLVSLLPRAAAETVEEVASAPEQKVTPNRRARFVHALRGIAIAAGDTVEQVTMAPEPGASVSPQTTKPPRRQRTITALRGVAIAGASIILLGMTVFPLQVANEISSLATTVLIILSWAILITVAESALQQARPLELFRLVGFRSVPLVTLFLALPLVVSQIAPVATVHAIQDQASVDIVFDEEGVVHPLYRDLGQRPTLRTAFNTWKGHAPCSAKTPGGSYRPLIVVAAQGGGIRAATWTLDIMREFLKTDCSSNAVLMSSGSSGGSVGLAQFAGLDRARNIPTSLILGQEALSAGLIGTLVTDPLASTIGLRIPTKPGYANAAGSWIWQDRAALIQAQWINDYSPYANSYNFSPHRGVGYLVFNSTAVGTGCRAIVSQVDFGIGAPLTDDGSDTRKAACNNDAPGVSAMIDILHYCDLTSDWATAAMLSARFPVVTPAARLAGLTDQSTQCRGLADMQFVDGGYAENSGLGTLSDVAPELADLITESNATRAEDEDPIVPFVLYIRNEAGADVTAPRLAPTSELLVHFLAVGTKDALTSDQAWLQRLSDTFSHVCPVGDDDCTNAIVWARENVPGGVAVAAPSTHPALVAPLGWTLSPASQRQLFAETALQEQPNCGTPRKDRYGRFGDLMQVVGLERECTPHP
ncbi:hypothetical protein BH09ACT4_BH09ACT4_04900 [soil metagenome]